MGFNSNNRSSYSRLASQDEAKESLYKIALDDTSPEYGGIPLFYDSNDSAMYVEKNDCHSLIIGASGSKKSRLIGMPALQIYAMAGESFIANDPKSELYKKTYKTLKDRDYKIIVLNLRDTKRSNSWNPLLVPYLQYRDGQKDKAIEYVIDMASCIAKSEWSREPYWENSAADLLTGLILLLFEYANENEIHFKSLRALRTQAFQNNNKYSNYIKDNFLRHLDNANASILPYLLSGTAGAPDDTRSCIISVFDQVMRPFFCQDNLIDMLSGSDFDFSSIGKTKTAVFMITPDENTVYNMLITLFVKQCYTELLREAEKHPDNRLPLRVNFLLDEFANLPAIPDFPSMITASRSRNIRFNLIIQNQNQLVERYGCQAETIKGNCENWVFLHNRELQQLHEIVGLSGMRNSDISLISPTILQTLNKEKGEALILNKRLNPYIANLLDIDKYPNIPVEDKDIPYPETACKADTVFDFKNHCEKIEANYFEEENIDFMPIFTSKVSDDNTPEQIENQENSTHEITLEQYGSSVGLGWHGLLSPIFEEINLYNKKNKGNEIRISQIKEKYGTLSIHVSNCPDYIEGMINIAEKESGYICEMCGSRGETVSINHWYKTLCPHHAKAKKAAGYDNDVDFTPLGLHS
jgi:type IV secretion system protein VirD4